MSDPGTGIPQTIGTTYSSYDVATSSFISEYNLVATISLLLWDIIVTLPREKTYIWSYHARVNWITLFYIITRYLPFIVSVIVLAPPINLFNIVKFAQIGFDNHGRPPSNRLIKFLSMIYIIPWFFVLSCTEILFIRRIVALHGGSRLLLKLLACLFICEVISALVIFFVYTFVNESVTHVTYMTEYGVIFQIVTTISFSETYFAFPELILQGVLVTLIINKLFLDWKRGTKSGHLGSILIRDGLWSYFFNLFSLLIVIIRPSWLSGPIGLPNILWSYVSFSVTSTRLILNIREIAAKQSGPNTVTGNASTFDFQVHSGTGPNMVRTFLQSGMDELSTPYHYHDLGHDSDSEND